MSDDLKLKLLSQQNEFLEWLKLKTTLRKLRYIDNHSKDDEVESAYKSVVMDYERAIMYHVRTKLWHNHRTAIREHKKYYGNQLRKPFGMAIVDFNNRMREYGALLCHLPPLLSKIVTKSFAPVHAFGVKIVSINLTLFFTKVSPSNANFEFLGF